MGDEKNPKLVEELKQFFPTRDELSKFTQVNNNEQENKDLHSYAEFLDHLSQCNTDDCGIHKAKDDLESNAWGRGFILGFKVRDSKK